MTIDFTLPQPIADLEAELRRFAERDLRPRMREFEAAGTWDEQTLKVLDGFGVAGLDLHERWGGGGAGMLGKVVALEVVASGDAGGLPAADGIGPAGGALLVAPNDVGSSIASASLARDGSCHLALDGKGTLPWVPGADAPRWTFVSEGSDLELLDTSGCEVRPSEMGAFDASRGVSLDLANASPEGEWEIGDDRGMWVRGRARLWVAAVSIGVARASLDHAISYAKERVVMGRPVAHHQGNAFAIAGAWGAVEAARASVRAAAIRIDQETETAGLWATLAYLDALDAASEATDLGVQLLGGHGYVEDHPVEKWFREARALAHLLGGRDAAVEDAASAVLDAPDPLLS